MSHVTLLSFVIKSLEALKMACKRLGLEFMENQTTYKWFGRWVGDYPLPKGFKKEQLGHCTHAIRVPGADYEIGVVVGKDGEISLLWDFWSAGGLENVLGKGGYKLEQAYIIEDGKLEAAKQGYAAIEEEQENGDVKLYIEVNE